MSASQIAGAVILFLVFAGIFTVIGVVDSWRAASIVFAFAVPLTGVVMLGCYLLAGPS